MEPTENRRNGGTVCFSSFLDICLVNSYIAYSEFNEKIPSQDYKRSVVMGLFIIGQSPSRKRDSGSKDGGQCLKRRNSTYFWTDSTIALYWITGEPSQLKLFVQNRVIEIQRLRDISSWRHCPGVKNPADLMTREISANQLVVHACSRACGS